MGKNTRVWIDKWVEDPELGMRAPWRKNVTFDVKLRADSLIDSSSRKWNVSSLQAIFIPADVELILAKQPLTARADYFSWKFNKSGNLSVKSAYWLARDAKIREQHPQALALPSINPIKDQIWKVKMAPKIRTFLWKAVSEALPVADLIRSRGIKIDDRCRMCGLDGESIYHMLFQCDPARQVWALSGIPQAKFGLQDGNMFMNLNYLLNMKPSHQVAVEDLRAWPWVIWFIWKSRNDLIFNGIRWHPSEIQAKEKEAAEEWFLSQLVE